MVPSRGPGAAAWALRTHSWASGVWVISRQTHEPRGAFDPPVLRIESPRADCQHAALWPRR